MKKFTLPAYGSLAKKIRIGIIASLLSPVIGFGQLTIGADGLFVAAGETLSFDGITFVPDAGGSGYTFSNTTLTRTNDWTITPATVNPYLKKYFSFSTTQTGYTGSITIDHADVSPKESSTGANDMGTTTDLRLNLSPDGTAWTVPTAGTIDATTVEGTVTTSSLNTFAVALVGSPLPVSLLSFSGKLQSNGVLLNWVTASEQNSSHFDVERSGNGRAFNKIGEVAAAGNSNVRKSYDYLDATPLPKASWYRLKSVDTDGKSAYSQILPITRDAKISSYPNPVSNHLQLQLSADWNGTYDLVVYDLSGRNVMSTQVKAGSYMFDCSNWASGIYNVVMYQDKQQVYAQRIVKK